MKLSRVLVLACLLCLAAATAHAAQYRIAINQFVEHPALDAVLKGFQDDLKDSGVDVEYLVYNAQGNIATTNLVSSKIAGDAPDMVVAIATPSAQASVAIMAKAGHMAKVPTLFTAITDPIKAGLVPSLEKPGGNVTGVSNQMPMDKPVDMLETYFPGVKRVGVIYNGGEDNSVSNVERLKAAAEKRGIEIIDAQVARSSDVTQATKSLVGRADVAFVPTDNTVVASIESAIKVCQDAKLPLFCMDADSVRKGVIAAVAFDYYLHGRQTGAMARRILAGEKPADNPVEFQKKLGIYLNTKAAEAMGLKLNQKQMDAADKLF